MRSTTAGIGGLGAAFLGALCCIGPLVFVTFGVGAGLAAAFEPLRPLFGVIMVFLFAFAFQSVYGRRVSLPPSTEHAGSAGIASCAAPRARKHEKLILWSALIAAIVLWTFPTWSTWLV